MAHGPFSDNDDEMMSEINMIPLIDVMLVLLIVFIITVPVMKHAVQVELPQASTAPEQPRPETVQLSVDAQGRYFWNDQPLPDEAALATRLGDLARQDPQPALHIRGDRAARYERVALALAAANQAGVRAIGFVTEPGP